MRIGFDAKRAFHNNSGLGNYSRDLIRILSNSWINDEFFLFNPKIKERDFGQNPNNCQQINPNKAWKKIAAVWRSIGITKVLQKEKIDIYHGLSNELPQNISALKSIVCIHDLIFERFPEWYNTLDRKIYRIKFKSAAENANVVIAISEQTKQDLVSYYKIPQEKIKVVYQGCHSAFQLEDNSQDLQTKKKFNLPTKYLLSVGTIEPRKNLLTVIKAIKDLESVELVIVGKETKYTQLIRSYIAKNSMTNRVHFLKNVSMPELASMYRLAHCFAYASQFEGFGIPIIEALFSNTPVITSTGSCFSEAGGPSSIYLPFNNVEQWKANIESLWNDEPRRQEMISKGYNYVQKFTDQNILKSWETIYLPFR